MARPEWECCIIEGTWGASRTGVVEFGAGAPVGINSAGAPVGVDGGPRQRKIKMRTTDICQALPAW